MPYYKKVLNKKNKLILFGGLLIPLFVFLNRFLIPDVSFDSINYHIFSGDRFSSFWKFINVEFFSAGLHSFPPFFDYLGGIFRLIFGYRLGSICSLFFLYGIIYLIYKIVSIFIKKRISSSLLLVLFFINTFISLEFFFQLGTYYVDIIGAFFVLWALYYIILYIKNNDIKFLYFGSFIIGLSVAGKLTNLIYLIPLTVMLIVWEFKKRDCYRDKLKHLVIYALLVFIPIGISCFENVVKTGNPFFPFYNSVFKSKYYPAVNFDNTNFGGRNFFEKLLWPIFSVKNPARLSEGHDLFNDYKLNLYFVLLLPSLYFSYKLRRKDRLFYYLNLYLFGSFMVWNFSFGYLRYAFVLEILSGLIVLIWVSKLLKRRSSVNKDRLLLLLIPLLFLLGYLDKRAINVNLAYDLSWRKTLTYNRRDYLKEYKYFFINKLDSVGVDDINKPDVYVNCSAPGLSFYSLSQFNKLPVVEIDTRSSGAMTLNSFYQDEVNRRISNFYNNRKTIKFVTIVGSYGHINQMSDCLLNLSIRKYSVKKEIPVDNFLGYKGEKLIYIFGEYSL